MDYRVELVLTVMKNDLHREVSLDQLAQSVNLSLSRFHYLFRIETGMSPARYRRQLRIRKAKDLLETTFLSAKQIRICVGIDDRSHFEREFKKIYGLTPAKCRRISLRVASFQEKSNKIEMATK